MAPRPMVPVMHDSGIDYKCVKMVCTITPAVSPPVVPSPHSVRKGDYWIRHHLSVRPCTQLTFNFPCTIVNSSPDYVPNIAHFAKNTIILSRRGTLELRVHWILQDHMSVWDKFADWKELKYWILAEARISDIGYRLEETDVPSLNA